MVSKLLLPSNNDVSKGDDGIKGKRMFSIRTLRLDQSDQSKKKGRE